MKRKIINILLILSLLIIIPSTLYDVDANDTNLQFYALRRKVLEFAQQHKDKDEVIVVSVKSRLLFYCKNQKIVENVRWQGFTFNFPVKVSLGYNSWHPTPLGEFSIYNKNPHSQYTLFLGFKGLYGIHGASTRLASYLDKMEAENPELTYVTKRDGTRGCVGVENRVVKYLYSQIDVGTPMLVLP